MTIVPVLASEDKLDQTKLINLAMYNPFNTLYFGTGLIVFDWLIGAHDGHLQNLSHSFLVGNNHLANYL
jgi:serine/threonine protein kinase HipA of HipAB toxin-antitoxin module